MEIPKSPAAKPAVRRSAGSSITLDQFKSEIEKRAKEIYHKRRGSNAPGDALSDWLQAEKEVKAKRRMV